MPEVRRVFFNFLMFVFSATLLNIGPAQECTCIAIHPSHSVPAYPIICPDFRLIFCFRLDQPQVFQGANDEYAPSANSLTIYKSVWVSLDPWARRCVFFATSLRIRLMSTSLFAIHVV